MSGVNVHVYRSPMRHESRMLRETRSIADLGVFDEILLIGYREDDLAEVEELDSTRCIWRIPLAASALPGGGLGKAAAYGEWTMRVVSRLRGRRVSMVNCHSVLCLPLCVALKRLHRATLIYDTHELETEAQGSELRRRVTRQIERHLLHHADRILVVNESIADWYRRTYGRRDVDAIRNLPARMAPPERGDLLRRRFGLETGDLLFICNGVLSAARGVQAILSAFASADRHHHVVFMGWGPLEETIRSHAAEHPNIHFHPAVPPEEVLDVTAGADVGLALIENTCLSYYYCLPNKLFEYIVAGLPVVASDFPEMSRVVAEHRCGWTVEPTAAGLGTLLRSLTAEDVEARTLAARAAREVLDWAVESEKLQRLYREMGIG